jgi:uncharacterized membrane protein YccF (DUF307 family)
MGNTTGSGPDESSGQAITQNVNVSIEQEDTSPSVVVRGAYFLLFGWWASGVWLSIAWLFNLTIIGMPLGIKMINFVPKIVSLKDRTIETERTVDGDGNVTITQGTSEQYSLPLRAAYFLLVGWWASGVWVFFAWVASITIVGLPLAVWMYDRLPFVVSLYNY